MRRLSLVGLLLAAAALTATPSSAAVYEKVRYSDEPYSFSYDGCGFIVDVEGISSGQYITRTGKGKTESAFFGHDNYSITETQTNTETGESITVVAHGNFNEIKAERVEGSVFKFTAVDAFNVRIYDEAGNLIARERGSIMSSILFDTEGDDVPGGVFLEFLGERINGQTVDYCELLSP